MVVLLARLAKELAYQPVSRVVALHAQVLVWYARLLSYYAYLLSWLSWTLLQRDLATDNLLDAARHRSLLLASAKEHAWMALGLALRPFFSTPGLFERRCVARAMHLDPPPHRIEVRHVETCAVNGGRDVLRATLWLPLGSSADVPAALVTRRLTLL